MNRITITIYIGALLPACAVPSTPEQRPAFAQQYEGIPFSYKIVETETFKYGERVETYYIEGEVVREPAHFRPASNYVAFDPWTFPFNETRLLHDFNATKVSEFGPLISWEVAIGKSITVRFETEKISLEGLEDLAWRRGYRGPYVFSSLKAVKVFKQVLAIDEMRRNYGIRAVGFDGFEDFTDVYSGAK